MPILLKKAAMGVIKKAAKGAAEKIAVDAVLKEADKVRDSLNEEITISRKLRFLELGLALLTGLVVGMLISPRRKAIAADSSKDDDKDEEEKKLKRGRKTRKK